MKVVELFADDAKKDPEHSKEMLATETLLEMAKESGIEDLIIIGTNEEGEFRLVTTPLEVAQVYFLLAQAQQFVIHG